MLWGHDMLADTASCRDHCCVMVFTCLRRHLAPKVARQSWLSKSVTRACLRKSLQCAVHDPQGKYVSPRVTNLALQYLGHAIKTAATWKLLKPHAPALVSAVALPLMCYDDEDDELWRDDPHEYIRKVNAGRSQ